MRRFYIEYYQDNGYAAMSLRMATIEASSIRMARKQWKKLLIEQAPDNICRSIIGDTPEKMYELKGKFSYLSDKELFDFNDPPLICSFNLNGHCSVPECTKGNLPYGCYTTAREEWEILWADWVCPPDEYESRICRLLMCRFFKRLFSQFKNTWVV